MSRAAGDMIHNRRFCILAAALWWGSLGTVGFFVVPMLFAHLQPAALAGNTAAHLFSGQTWISAVCAMLLIVASRGRGRSGDGGDGGGFPAYGWVALVLAGLLLALLSEFAVSPRIVARENLKLWHAVGTAFYFCQWACAGLALWRLLTPNDNKPAQG
ncbi:DUF4149 domain-containing protein [Xylophilus sp. GOD-11R]|uniref:DUF4149 domain-containing protein n=1 Tax=Xylophilus sp. GOD-11R TaxID=3089814 RepID=UPI00298CB95D|nr:DUF4149 domain-containing protein [Xylophilus sp. GOD-11R]WPB58695.1 DUF4149 domain-containing protein [Xylophilus sp. GOD-11R]